MQDLILSDCFEKIKDINDKSIDLIIFDPPYNIGADKWDNISNYFDWIKSIISLGLNKLKNNGSFYIWGTSKNNDFLRLKLWLDESQNNFTFRNWIVWVHDCKIHKKLKNKYLTKHEDLLFYSGENATFNIERDNPPLEQLKIFDGKYDSNFFVERSKLPPSQQKIFKNGLQLGSPAKSWWKGPANQSNGKIIKHSGYKSEWVCERMIKVSSNINDIILIPFAGSGTECVIAKKFDRQFIGIEKEEKYFNIAEQRLNYNKI